MQKFPKYPDDVPAELAARYWPRQGFALTAYVFGFPPVPGIPAELRQALDQGRKLSAEERKRLTAEVKAHAAELGVPIVIGNHAPVFDAGRAVVFAPSITTDTRYAATMHELGHAATLTPDSPVRESVTLEAQAWKWALPRLSIHLSADSEKANVEAFDSYRTFARRGEKKVLASVEAQIAAA